ncbi:LCP family protein [Ligilactobacillus saerimneri]|uniref:Eps transcriptional regulator n=1 Tax=Ligilactobacillus saerimneri 30a TaxID=1227363 RepID=M5J850_9LACO|nr:LCP family protein [Ligilactobacillus saerimneri]EKW99649.1 Eps transcriptional regulator [Ligilactobacillus saerimneri 30a]MBU5309633.1 LCP family protein [Ligilactobacillus saerimneri]
MDTEQQEYRRPRHPQKKHHWGRWFWGVIGVLVLIALFFAGKAWMNVRNATSKMYTPSGATSSAELSSKLGDGKPVSFLLLGTDTGALGRSYKGRTDTMMVMTVNPQKKKTTIVSIPRDMRVNLAGDPENSPAKINAAYTYGGVKEAINTVKDYFHVPINGYLLVNMGGLEKAIDQVGGVTVTSPLTFSYDGYSFTEGQATEMNGAKALAFSRMRHEDPQGDYGRQQRQRLVIMALLKESASYKSILNNDFLDSVSSMAQTDLTMSNMTQLAAHYRGAVGNVKSDHAQGKSANINGISYEVVSLAERQRVSNELRQSLGLSKVTLSEE